MPQSKPHLRANYMVSNNFSFPMTIEGGEGGGGKIIA